MINSTHSLRLAGTALAAVLAIVSTSSLAQDPQAPLPASPDPVVVVPEIAVPAAPEPMMVQQPTVQPVPEPAVDASAPPAAVRGQAPAVTSRSRAEPPQRTAPVPQTDPTTSLPEPATVLPVEAAAPQPTSIEHASLAPAERADARILAVVLAGLVILALAIWGFVAISRPRPMRRYVGESTASTPNRIAGAPAGVIAPTAAPVRPSAPESASSRPTSAERPVSLLEPVVGGVLPHTGAAVALPRALPDSFDQREALFRRLVDAHPDRANPFTDRKARMKRARLIMQSIGRDFGDTEPWIDLSQYPHNWPELLQRSAAA